jgi:hypothetical protein
MDAFRDSTGEGGVMTAQVSEAARQLAARLADAFEQDRALAEQLNDCQDRLRAGNDRLWSGLHPDALGRVYDDTAGGGVSQGSSAVAEQLLDALRAGLPAAEVEASVLPGLQDRRHLAAEIGELIAGLVAELVAAGWPEDQARNADVQQLAVATAR